MHRFFLPSASIGESLVTFPAQTAHQIARVLRLKPDEHVIVLDNLGWEYEVKLLEVERELVRGEVLTRQQATTEPKVKVGMYLGLTQREKFEWMLQKCAEVGASEFTPMITSRSLAQNLGEVEHKRERWERILQEAAEQSGRGIIPIVRPALTFRDSLRDSMRFSLRLIPWEQEKIIPLRKTVMAHCLGCETRLEAAVFIGCEGGFSNEEIQQAIEAGLQPVTLGARILRMETAAIVAAALIVDAADTPQS
jgi:16S rRNA (uracil1498-N3)-methyltransferase